MKRGRRVATLVALFWAAACGSQEASTPVADAPQEVIDALKTPDSPYRNIYYPPVDLARPASVR